MSAYAGRRHAGLDRESLRVAMRAAHLNEMAVALGADYRAVLRARDGLSIEQAERWAMKAGFVPAEVWACWPEVVLAARRARDAAAKRRYRATRKGRESNRRAVAKWRASLSPAAHAARRVKDAARARERHWANRERNLAKMRERRQRLRMMENLNKGATAPQAGKAEGQQSAASALPDPQSSAARVRRVAAA